MGQWLSIYLKGLAMGAADSVPGISGGTIALITGIYERLVSAIASLRPSILFDLAQSYDPEARASAWRSFVEMDLPFLLVLGAGIASALVGVTRAMTTAYEVYPALTYAFFFGLIAASAVVLYRHVALDSPGRIGAAVAGVVIAFVISGAAVAGLPRTPVAIFLLGALAISAMVLPGISGAFILVLFGQYYYMSDVLHSFIDASLAALTGGQLAAVVEYGTTVATFLVGAAVGLVTFAHLVDRALDRYREATLAFLVSLMAGSLRLPVSRILESRPAWSTTAVATVLLSALVGAAIVLMLDHYTDDLEYAEVEGIGGTTPERAD